MGKMVFRRCSIFPWLLCVTTTRQAHVQASRSGARLRAKRCNLLSEDSMECSCPISGFCERRRRVMSSVHHRKCQAGMVEHLDQLYAQIDTASLPIDAAPKREKKRTPGRSVGTSKKTSKSCAGCSKPKGIVARTVDRVVSLKNAAVDFVRDGMAIASEEQQAKRSAICASCH